MDFGFETTWLINLILKIRSSVYFLLPILFLIIISNFTKRGQEEDQEAHKII